MNHYSFARSSMLPSCHVVVSGIFASVKKSHSKFVINVCFYFPESQDHFSNNICLE